MSEQVQNGLPFSKLGRVEEFKVTVKIYVILGCEIKTMVNETQKTGNYSVIFNVPSLSSIINFYSLETQKIY